MHWKWTGPTRIKAKCPHCLYKWEIGVPIQFEENKGKETCKNSSILFVNEEAYQDERERLDKIQTASDFARQMLELEDLKQEYEQKERERTEDEYNATIRRVMETGQRARQSSIRGKHLHEQNSPRNRPTKKND